MFNSGKIKIIVMKVDDIKPVLTNTQLDRGCIKISFCNHL